MDNIKEALNIGLSFAKYHAEHNEFLIGGEMQKQADADVKTIRDALEECDRMTAHPIVDQDLAELVIERFPNQIDKQSAMQHMDFRHGAMEIIKVLKEKGYLKI